MKFRANPDKKTSRKAVLSNLPQRSFADDAEARGESLTEV
jgi:hypothetical protein